MRDDDIEGRAPREYDPEFERTVADAVSAAIAQVSLVTDANAMVLRTGEIIAALTTVLASAIVLSPAIMRILVMADRHSI